MKNLLAVVVLVFVLAGCSTMDHNGVGFGNAINLGAGIGKAIAGDKMNPHLDGILGAAGAVGTGVDQARQTRRIEQLEQNAAQTSTQPAANAVTSKQYEEVTVTGPDGKPVTTRREIVKSQAQEVGYAGAK